MQGRRQVSAQDRQAGRDTVICGGLGGQTSQAHPASAAHLWVVLSKMLLVPWSVCFLVSIDSEDCEWYF